MGNPQTTAAPGETPAAQLREDLLSYFEVDDLESLCFDLGVDYSGLPGDGKASKVVSLLEYFGRNGHIVDLIDRCAQLRPNVSWANVRAAAVANPSLFRPISLEPDVLLGGQPLVNVAADRALKIGIAIGIIAVLLLLCGFSGGLLASRFVAITLNPVQVDTGAGVAAASELATVQALPLGEVHTVTYSNIKATSLADKLLVGSNSPISEVHMQFLSTGDIGMNVRLKALGNRRVVVGFAVQATTNGRLILTPKAVAVDLLGLNGTTFGWISVPVGFTGSFFSWLQAQLDQASQVFWFQSIRVRQDNLSVVLRKR